MNDYPLISVPLVGLYADVERLFPPENTAACRQALLMLGPVYAERGVAPVEGAPNTLRFPDKRTFNAFLDDMQRNGCRAHRDAAPSGFGRRAILRDEVSAEGSAVGESDLTAFLAFQFIPSDEIDGVMFEAMLPAGVASRTTQDMIYRHVVRACLRGVERAPLHACHIVLAELEFSRGVRETKRSGGSFFSVFDKVFDSIDRAFAGGSGTEFAEMAQRPDFTAQRLLGQAVDDAFDSVLRGGQYTITEPDANIRLRFPVERRDAVVPVFQRAGGVIKDEVHDGTLWTVIGTIPVKALYDDGDLSETLQRMDAILESD